MGQEVRCSWVLHQQAYAGSFLKPIHLESTRLDSSAWQNGVHPIRISVSMAGKHPNSMPEFRDCVVRWQYCVALQALVTGR